MNELIKVAGRNIGRNKRRTIITILTVFLGVVVCTGTRGLLNGLQDEIRSALTRKVYGDLQIHKTGYHDSLESSPYKLLIPDKANIGSGIQEAPRLRIMALLNHQKSQTTTPVMIMGIDSRQENLVCPRLAKTVRGGTMLDSALEKMPANVIDDNLEEAGGLEAAASPETQEKEAPRAEGFHQILLTPSLMRGMGAEVGDEIVVLLSDKDNMQQAIVAKVTGVIEMATPGAATRLAWMDLTSLQKTLGVEGLASEIALRIPEDGPLSKYQQVVAQKVPEGQIVETWLELGGFLRDVMALQEIIFSAIVTIMFAIVIAAIVNTSLMTVMERTREIGTLMALGYRRHHIVTLFLTEAGIIGCLGGVLGVVAGATLVGILRLKGLIVTLPGQAYPTELFPRITFEFSFLVFGLAVAAALISGLAPAYRASRMKPVEALSST
jgi:putative ABC transport system permease protein